MTQFRRRTARSAAVIALGIASLTAWMLPAGTAEARPTGHDRCVSVPATGIGQDLGGGQTTATIAVGGQPVGSTRAMFVIGAVTNGVASFTGQIVFTPQDIPGTLVAPVTGTFDLTTGAFTATSRTVVGTGALGRVRGSVSIDGIESLTTGAFTESLRSRLCSG